MAEIFPASINSHPDSEGVKASEDYQLFERNESAGPLHHKFSAQARRRIDFLDLLTNRVRADRTLALPRTLQTKVFLLTQRPSRE